MRLTWVQPEDLLAHELAACHDEGRDVAAIEGRWRESGGSTMPPGDARLRELAWDLLDELDVGRAPEPSPTLKPVAGLPTNVPGFDRMHGAWLGRAVGCLLGKPVEKIPRFGIRQILQATDRWPLSGYFTAAGLPEEVAQRWPWNRRSAGTSLAENIDGMPEDDDLNFALLALRILTTRGRDFTSADVAQAWLDWLPAGRVFTAERVAYRNLLLGLVPPESALRHNPFREWIGAQIRTDVYGWVNPGRPDVAAGMAWRDATVSHVRDGVHGAMWAAAMTSAAIATSKVDEVLDAGESVLPGDSRFAAAVREARVIASVHAGWERVVDELYTRHGHLHWVHVRNNAALVAAALAHGGGDFDRSICAVVSGGWDTDSNGATVGSVLGALTGAAAIAPRWTEPLRDTLRSSIAGFDGVTFTQLAHQTLRLAAREERWS